VNNKSLSSAFLTVILISSLILVGAVSFVPAQASADLSDIPKPSVPEFTVNFVDRSYDVPTTYYVDQYTGETVTNSGKHVENKTIELKIKNQPFTPYTEDGWQISLFYDVRIKAHYAENWVSLYAPVVIPLQPSNSEYTELCFLLTLSPTHPEQGYSLESYDTNTDSYSPRISGITSAAQIDFQVEAMIGYVSRTTEFASWAFTGEESGWSNTQTVFIPELTLPTSPPAETPTQAPTQTPSSSTFSVESNSTVTNLFFNSTSSELSFTVNGTTGTAGYVEITIAKNLLSSVQNVKAYLDGSELVVSITSDETSWFLSFNYLHSTHNVKINLATSATDVTFVGLDFLLGLGVGLGIAVVGVCLLFYLKKRNR
jgi:hypothetical protein